MLFRFFFVLFTGKASKWVECYMSKRMQNWGGNCEENDTARVSVRQIRSGTNNYYSPKKKKKDIDVAINYIAPNVRRQRTLIIVGFKDISRKNTPSLVVIDLQYEAPRWRL